MTIEYDEKGKFYTNVIPKVPVPAVMQTTTHLVRGFVHVRQGERLKSELDRDEAFLAITDAIVYGPENAILFNAPFMAIQRSQIVWIMPAKADDPDELEE